MKQFIARFQDQIQGTLSGFDRVVFRGTLRRLTHSQGMKMYLIQNGILCKQYQDHVKPVSQELREASREPFRQQQLPIRHIYAPRTDKEELARAVDVLHNAEKELEERTAWALRLDEEKRQLEEARRGLEQQLAMVRASRWVKLGRRFGLGPELPAG